MPDWVRGQPVVMDRLVYAAAMDGTVTCLRDQGDGATVVWRRQVGTHPIYADPVPAGDRLLVTTSDLQLFCLDAGTGDTIWCRALLPEANVNGHTYRADELGAGGWYQSKPTAAEDKVFIGTPSRFVFALDPATGDEVWRFELGAAVSGAPAFGRLPDERHGRIFVGQQGGEDYFYCLHAETGLPLWKQATGWVWSSATYSQGRVYMGGVDGYLSCLDAATGSIRWRYRTAGGQTRLGSYPEPPIEDGRIFFGSWDHYVYAFDAVTGDVLWQFHTGGSPDSGAPIACGGRLYLPMGGKRFSCLDTATGHVIWDYLIEDGCMNATPSLWDGKLYISTSVRQGAIPWASRIRCLDAATGEELWEHPGGGITGSSVADGKVYFASTSDPYFTCVDAQGNGDGTTTCLWRCELGERVYESVPAIYQGRAYILSEAGYLFALE